MTPALKHILALFEICIKIWLFAIKNSVLIHFAKAVMLIHVALNTF